MGLALPWRRARQMIWLRENGVVRTVIVTERGDLKFYLYGYRLWLIRWVDEAGGNGKSRMQLLLGFFRDWHV